MSGTLTIGLWQSAGTPGDVARNLAEAAHAARQAQARQVDLLVFPECFLTGYQTDNPAAIAATMPDDTPARLAAIARDTGIGLIVGSYDRSEGLLQNAALFVCPERGLIGRYAKRMLYGDWEKEHFRRGTGPLVLDWRGWRLAVLICFDIEFPALPREAARLGCEALIVPTALMAPYAAVPAHLVATRALENQMFVAYANRIGADGPTFYLGQSVIAGPDGGILARASDDQTSPHMVVAKLDRQAIVRARADFSYLAEEAGL
jgi:predicted amidohydrolase